MHKEVILFIVVSLPPTLLFHNRSKSQVADLPAWAGHSSTMRRAFDNTSDRHGEIGAN